MGGAARIFSGLMRRAGMKSTWDVGCLHHLKNVKTDDTEVGANEQMMRNVAAAVVVAEVRRG